jgi:hypothetical protein
MATFNRPRRIGALSPLPEIGGIAHTHSEAATAFAQACREIHVWERRKLITQWFRAVTAFIEKKSKTIMN